MGFGVSQTHMTFKQLMQISRLGNEHRIPVAIRQQPGIDVNTGQRSQGGVEGMDLEVILPARSPGPVVFGGWGAFVRMRVATEQLFEQVHFGLNVRSI